jgi:hypothetical protein
LRHTSGNDWRQKEQNWSIGRTSHGPKDCQRKRVESALYVVISGGLPRRLSRAVTTAACCLLRRPSAALTACRGRGRPIPACRSPRIVLPRPLTAAGRGAGVRRKRERPEPTWLAAWRELKPQRRALSQAQAQIRGAGPAPSRRRPGNASAAQRPTPPRQLSRRDRSKLPHPSRPRQPARATAAPYRQARHHVARPRHQRRDATRVRSGQYRPATTQGNTCSAQKAQNHCSARLTSYQAATRIRYLAPQNTRIYIRIMLLSWVELSGLQPLTSCMP